MDRCSHFAPNLGDDLLGEGDREELLSGGALVTRRDRIVRGVGHAISVLWAEFGLKPITMLAVQLRAFCAPPEPGGDRGLRPGADGRRSGQSR